MSFEIQVPLPRGMSTPTLVQDLTLLAGTQRWTVNRRLMIYHSQALARAMEKQPIFSVRLDIPPETVERVLSFCYGMRVTVTLRDADTLEFAGERLQISSLCQALADVFPLACLVQDIFGSQEALNSEICQSVLARAFPLLATDPRMMELRPSVIRGVISDRDLCLDHEWMLVTFLLAYYETRKNDIEALELFSLVKAEYLTQGQCEALLKHDKNVVRPMMERRLCFLVTDDMEAVAAIRFTKMDMKERCKRIMSHLRCDWAGPGAQRLQQLMNPARP